MPVPRRRFWGFLLALTLVGPGACRGDQGRDRLQTGDPRGDANPPSVGGAVAELREQLSSEDPVLRSAAAGRLIEMKTEEARQALAEVLTTGKEPAVLDLLKVIGSTKDPRLLPMVVQRLRGTSDAVVDATVGCLDCFDREKVADELLSALSRKDLGMAESSHLVQALARTRQRKAVPRLIEMFRLSDAALHERVVEALFLLTGHRLRKAEEWQAWWEKNKDRSREDWQEEALRSENGGPQSDIGAELARAEIDLLTLRLAQIPADKGAERLALVREALEYRYCPQVRVFGIGEAAKLPAKERALALDPILAMAQRDPSEEVRAAGLEAAGAICWSGGPVTDAQRAAAGVLGASAATDPVARVRIAAVRGLARLNGSVAVEKIRPVLSDKDLGVQEAAVEALGRLGGASSMQILSDLLPQTDGSPELRKAVVDAMGDLAAPEIVPPLVALLARAQGDDARPLRWSIANSLGRAHSRDGLSALRRLMDDKFLDVRVKAIQGLGAAGGIDEVQPLSVVLRQGTRDPKERAAAAVALGQTGQASALPDLVASVEDDDAVAADAWKAVLLLVGTDRARAVDVAKRLLERKDWSRAIELLDPVVKDAELQKASPAVAAEARDRMGTALLGAGSRTEALPYLKECAERKDAPPEAKIAWLQTLLDLKRYSEVVAGAEQALADAGAGPALREAATRLRDAARSGLDAAQREEGAVRAKVDALLVDLAGADAPRRASAMEELRRLGRKAVPELLAAVSTEDGSRWPPASKALGELTRIEHPLEAKSTPEERQKAVSEWRAWLDQR